MTTEISVYRQVADPLAFAMQFGTEMAKARMFGCENESQGRVLAMACLAEGKNPLQIARKNHIIQGNLSMKSDAMLAEFHAIGGKHQIVERTPEAAEVKLTIDDETYTERVTWEDMRQEPTPFEKDGKTLKKNWRTPRARRQMLWARAISEAVRTLRPGIVSGTYTPEEIQDFDEQTAKVNGHPVVDVEEFAKSKQQQATAPKQEAEDAEFEPKDDIGGESRLPDGATASHVTGPCGQALVDEIKSLLSGEPELIQQVKQHLQKHGKAKIADLSHQDAELLRNSLQIRSMEEFFDRSLSKN